VDDPANVFFVRTASDVPGDAWVFNRPFYLLMNLAVGGDGAWPGPPDATTPTPAVMTVDYVRIYQAAAVPAPSFGAPPSMVVKAGATTGNTSTFSAGSTPGSGRVYLACTTTAPNATCQVNTTDALDAYTLDFTNSATGTVTVSLATTANTVAAGAVYRWDAGSSGSVAGMLMACAIFYFLFRWRGKVFRPMPAVGISLCLSAVILLGCSRGSSTPLPSGGTTPGSYTIKLNAYTVSGNGTQPDATVNLSVTVN
jgi:hypothetical protein